MRAIPMAVPTEAGTLRASDAERDQVVGTLGDHFAAGRLLLPELEDRVDRALRAETRAELVALTADLPVATPAPAPRGPRPTPRVAAARTGGWGPWLLTAVICLVVWLATSVGQGSVGYFWPGWVIGPWAVALMGGPCRTRRAALTGPGRL